MFNKKLNYKSILFISSAFALSHLNNEVSAQCFTNSSINTPATASYATGGNGQYKSDIIWFTWGSDNASTNPYGKHNEILNTPAKRTSRASIEIAQGKYLCIEMEIISNTKDISSYRPGDYSGDSFDNLYNIGGTDANNQLIAGIINNTEGDNPVITIKATATFDGQPYKIKGLVVADAESLDSSGNEWIKATAKGTWSVMEVLKNTSKGAYNARKSNNTSTGENTIEFILGNDDHTAAINVLTFNQNAYGLAADNYPVEFTVDFKGSGKTAIAIGLIPGAIDMGDAPESYGDAMHFLLNEKVGEDGILTDGRTVNLNHSNYTAGGLQFEDKKFLGSTAPDGDTVSVYTIDADGDNSTGTSGANEEDAWPENLRIIDYSFFTNNNNLVANIPYQKAEIGDKIYAWIDFDENGTFDSNEMQNATINENGNGSVNLTWPIPNTIDPESLGKRLYVRIRYFDKNESNTNPTGIVNLGEVEDFAIRLKTQIEGNVYHDKDGLEDNNIAKHHNGNFNEKINPATSTYVLLTDEDNKVVKITAVKADGTYMIDTVFNGTYKVILSENGANIGDIVSIASINDAWTFTGENKGNYDNNNYGIVDGINDNIVVQGKNRDEINFGVEQIPVADPKSYTWDDGTRPSLNGEYNLVNQHLQLSGIDEEDGVYDGSTGTIYAPKGIVITALPDNGILYYNSMEVSVANLNSTIYEDPSLFSLKYTTQQSTTINFKYAYIDFAGKQGKDAFYHIEWDWPLPIELAYFNANKKGDFALLNWTTHLEKDAKHFEIEKSTNAKDWATIGKVMANEFDTKEVKNYNFLDKNTIIGINLYRLKLVDNNGEYKYSEVRQLVFDLINTLEIYPIPAKDYLNIKGLKAGQKVIIYNSLGQELRHLEFNINGNFEINIQNLPAGNYYLAVYNNDLFIESIKFIKE